MITKHFFTKCLLLGVILSVAFAGTAGAQNGFLVEVKIYCNGVEVDPRGGAPCQIGQEVTINAYREVDGMAQPVNADWDPDGNTYDDFRPEQFNTSTFRYVYDFPGYKDVVVKATDGSGFFQIGLTITDPDGRPDPTLQPAFAHVQSSFDVAKRGSLCQVRRSVTFRSYRDYTYSGRLEARYRFRPKSQNGQRARVKTGRVVLVKRGPAVNPAAYDVQFKRLSWTFDRSSSRIQRLIKLGATVTLSFRQRILQGSTVVRDERAKRRFSLSRCA